MRTVRPTIQRLTAGLAAVALGASLTACGGSDGSEAADDPVAADSSSATTPEPSDSAATDPAPLDDGGEIAPADFVARIQNGIKNTTYAHIVFTMTGAMGMQGEGDVDYTASPPNMKMTMSLSGQELDLLMVDKAMYIESPQAPGKYIKYDLDDPSNPLGSRLTGSLDPAASLSQFADAVSSVTSLGEEDVDGQSARPLRDDHRPQQAVGDAGRGHACGTWSRGSGSTTRTG